MEPLPSLWLGDLLRSGGLDLSSTRLVRHREVRNGRAADARLRAAAVGLAPFFVEYQEIQGGLSFGNSRHIASFVVEPGIGTLFIGVWAVESVTPQPIPFHFGESAGRLHPGYRYDLRHDVRFDDFRGRLVIEWGEGARAWVQHADRQPKRIVALMRRAEAPFPGWARFSANLAEVFALPETWRQVLGAARGVYLVVHQGTGAQYVGAAYGGGGFLSRWLAYADGSAGNVGLLDLKHPAEEYAVSILWVASSRDGDEEVLAQQAFEKQRLGSRAHGLNRN